MADINNAAAITFVAQNIRPLCEHLRALVHEMADTQARWSAGVSSIIPDTADVVREDRPDGVPNLTAAQINSVMDFVDSLVAQLDGAAARQLLARACVRPLSVAF